MLICTFSSRSVPLICYSHRVYSLQTSSAPPALPYRTSSAPILASLSFFPSRMTSPSLTRKGTAGRARHREPPRREYCSQLFPARLPLAVYIIFSRILFSLRSLARACCKFFTLTIHHHPLSTASSTPFRRSACRTRGVPSSQRPSQCALRRKASTMKEKSFQVSL
jgi:hypothetical protein